MKLNIFIFAKSVHLGGWKGGWVADGCKMYLRIVHDNENRCFAFYVNIPMHSIKRPNLVMRLECYSFKSFGQLYLQKRKLSWFCSNASARQLPLPMIVSQIMPSNLFLYPLNVSQPQ